MSRYIEPNAHVFIAGATGSGKSFLAEEYLRGYDYVIKLDTKLETEERWEAGESPWRGLEEGKDFVVCQSLVECQQADTHKIIYSVPYDEQNEDNFNEFFRWVFERKNTIVWIDELMSFTTSFKYPYELGRCMIMGRSKGVGIWACTQRPQGIPSIVMANCKYFFIFRLNRYEDRKTVVNNTGFPEMMQTPTGHEFWYCKMGDESAKLCYLVPD
jgi:hypothetical protein